MKKILFATTALVATAGVAAADVTFGGYGRFGMRYDEDAQNIAGQKAETRIESRFRLTIDADTQSDNGITFGARVRIQADESSDKQGRGNANTAGFNGARFHAETGGFRVEVGNVSDAIDNMFNYYGYEPGISAPVGQYSNTGLPISGYSSTGPGVNGVSGIYSFGGFRAQLTGSKDTDGAATASTDRVSAGVSYAFSGYTVALAYTASENDAPGAVKLDGTALTFGGTVGAVDFAMLIADDSVEGTSYGMSGKFDVGAATSIVAAVSAGGDDVSTAKKTSYGVGVRHDLGGGVMLQAMVGRKNNDKNTADAGVQFNF